MIASILAVVTALDAQMQNHVRQSAFGLKLVFGYELGLLSCRITVSFVTAGLRLDNSTESINPATRAQKIDLAINLRCAHNFSGDS